MDGHGHSGGYQADGGVRFSSGSGSADGSGAGLTADEAMAALLIGRQEEASIFC